MGHPTKSKCSTSALNCLLLLLTLMPVLHCCLASDTVKAVLNKQGALVKRPISNLMGSKYMERVAGRYTSTHVDTSALYDMLSAQQEYRRGVTGGSGLDSKGSAYDCQPTYTVKKRVTDWFQTTTIEMGLCFTLCLDYPTCTTTAPLVLQPGFTGELGLLLRCGLKAISEGDDGKISLVEVMGRSSKVCRNVVDTSADKPGVRREEVSFTSNSPGGLTIQAFARKADATYTDQLILMGHDLWSHWEVQLLQFIPQDDKSKRDGITQRLVLPAVDGVVSKYLDNKNLSEVLKEASSWGATGQGGQPPLVVDGLWLVTGRLDDYLQASYLVMRPDLDGRWYAFFTYGSGNPNAWWNFADHPEKVNCSRAVDPSLWAVAADWNKSSLMPDSSRLPSGCRLSDGEDKLVQDVLSYGSRVFKAEERAKLQNKCPVLLNRTKDFARKTMGCDGKSDLFIINTPGFVVGSTMDICQRDQLFTTPVAESMLHSGALRGTYKDAWNVHTLLSKLPESDRFAMHVDVKVPGDAPTGQYVIIDASLQFKIDASLQFNTTDVKLRMDKALQKAEAFILTLKYEGESKSAIIVAFTALFIATVSIPQHWNEAIQNQVYKVLAAIPALLHHKAARVAYVGLCRFLASTIVVGPAMFSFLTVVARDTGVRIADGYPSISYQGSVGNPHCNNAMIGEPGFGVSETVVLETSVQTWAVVLVCCLSLIALLAATGIAMYGAATADITKLMAHTGNAVELAQPASAAAAFSARASGSGGGGGVPGEGGKHEIGMSSSRGYGANTNSLRIRVRENDRPMDATLENDVI